MPLQPEQTFCKSPDMGHTRNSAPPFRLKKELDKPGRHFSLPGLSSSSFFLNDALSEQAMP